VIGESVVITDVGPRDGLQNQPKTLAVAERVELINAVAAAGVPGIEVCSFVSPRAVPAMAGAAEVLSALPARPGCRYNCLIPNLRGYELAREAGATAVNMVLYASEGMAQKNANMSMAGAEEITADILSRARADGLEVIATVAVAFRCPFDGAIDPGVVRAVVARFLDLGADQLVIADTIGAADPGQVRSLTASLVDAHGAAQLGCHFHDTRAMGLANVFAAVESGIRRFDASVAGLGGCPFAPGATGNVATEDVVMMLEQMGFATGIDLDALLRASDLAQALTGNAPGGRAKAWLQPWLAKQAG